MAHAVVASANPDGCAAVNELPIVYTKLPEGGFSSGPMNRGRRHGRHLFYVNKKRATLHLEFYDGKLIQNSAMACFHDGSSQKITVAQNEAGVLFLHWV